jgi:hypothetical protein
MGGFSPLVALALFGFIPVGLLSFAFLPARRAVAAIWVLGWVFLPPNAKFGLPGLPDYTKFDAILLTSLIGSLIFDGKTFFKFRPAWYDLPALAVLLLPFASSMTNGLGINDGLSSVYGAFILWVGPYLLGRLYFADLQGMKELSLWIVAGCIICIPLCLIEMRLSPQLNNWLYGYHQVSRFDQTRRYGGWRPMLFMQHGLMVGLWMSVGTLIATVLWMSGSVKRFMAMPISFWAVTLGITTVMCRSFGALALLAIGLAVASIAKQARVPSLVLALTLLPVAYVTTRSSGLWDGSELVAASSQVAGAQRGGSLEFRIKNENTLVTHALKEPIFGWGGWGRNRPDRREAGHFIATDGLWVIQLGQRGLTGLVAFMLLFLLPPTLFLWRWGMLGMTHPWLAPAMAMCITVLLFMNDSLFNSMINPIYTIAAGGLTGLVMTPQVRQALGLQTRQDAWRRQQFARQQQQQAQREQAGGVPAVGRA